MGIIIFINRKMFGSSLFIKRMTFGTSLFIKRKTLWNFLSSHISFILVHVSFIKWKMFWTSVFTKGKISRPFICILPDRQGYCTEESDQNGSLHLVRSGISELYMTRVGIYTECF